MNSDLKIFLRACAEFLIVAGITGFVCLLPYIDINILHNGISEFSLVELVQELFLLSSALLFFRGARKRPEVRGGLILVGGFLFCMFIRELDVLFDLISHGSWFWFAIAATLICVSYAVIHPRTTLRGLVDVVSWRGYAMLLAGLMCVLIVSRVFGMQVLWEHILQEGYLRIVKNAVEEGTELFGYTLIFIASLGYAFQQRLPLR